MQGGTDLNSKKWCVLAICAFLTIFVFIAVLNVVSDPFGIFGDKVFNWYSYDMTNNPRTSKTAYIEEHGDDYDSYLIGCSSTSSFPTDDFGKALDAKFYNMIMYGADMADVEKSVKYLLENRTVKNIVLNVYLGNAVSYGTNSGSLTDSLHSHVSGESDTAFYLRYMLANPMYAFNKIRAAAFEDRYLSEVFDVFDAETGAYDKRKRDAEPISDLESYLEAYPIFKNYPKYEYTMPHIADNAESVRRIKEMCDNMGVNLIVVTAPVYYDYFLYFQKADIAEFYRTLADATGGFWDFAVSSISLDPRYFYDETHFRNAVGKMAAARVFGKEDIYIPDDFGTFVTSDNYAEHIDGFYGLKRDESAYTKKISVLLYHHIADEVTNPSIITPETIERQIAKVAKSGYTAVTIKDLENYIYRGIDLPKKSVLITFDDGYKSNLEIALPILEKYGLRATVFTVGSAMGDSYYKETANPCFPHLSTEDNRFLNDGGIIEVQSHTYDLHQSPEFELSLTCYDNMLKHDDETELEYVGRIRRDCEEMKKALGYEPKALSFPHGKSDILLQSILEECGIEFTFTTEYGSPTLIKGLPQSGYMLGRYTMYEETDDNHVFYFLDLSQVD